MKLKKMFCLCMAAILVFALAACGENKPAVKVDYGKSARYAKEDLESAEKLVEQKIAEFEGCELHSVTYAGDERSEAELESVNAFGEIAYADCVVFNTSFRSPKRAYGAWEPDTEYTWSFTLARVDGGAWEVVNYGY